MELYAIPFEGQYILYRPLLRRAVVGNRALVGLARAAGHSGAVPASPAHAEALDFLEAAGLLDPDPEPPAPPSAAFWPTTAILLMTNRCQLRCTYCYANGGVGPSAELPPSLALAAIERACQNARELGRPGFGLTFHGGGEPTRAWRLMQEAVAHARHQPLPCHVSMASNGIWSPRRREWILDNLDSLSLSLDGGPATQNGQRPFASGSGSFDRVIETVVALDARAFPYGIRMTATAPWRDRLPEDVRILCEQTGCSSIQVEPAFNTARGATRPPTNAEAREFADAFLAAHEIAERAGRRLFYSGARPWVVTGSFCSAPFDALIVGADGVLTSCFEVTGPDHPLAARSRYGRLEDGQVRLVGDTLPMLHQALAERRAGCRDCFCFWSCAGDCYARALTPEPGSRGRYGARCEMNRRITTGLLASAIARGGGVWDGSGEADPIDGAAGLATWETDGPGPVGDGAAGLATWAPARA